MKLKIIIMFLCSCFVLNTFGQSTHMDSSNCVTIYVYRPYLLMGYFKKNKILRNNTICFKVKNNSVQQIVECKFGMIELEVKSIESKSTVAINLEKGKKYFVRCTNRRGIIAVRPKLELVDDKIGLVEIKEIEESLKEELSE